MELALYKIEEAIQHVTLQGFKVDEETGEVLFDSSDLDKLEIAKEDKVLNIAKMIKTHDHFLKGLSQQKKDIDQRIKTQKSKIEHWKQYLKQ